MTFRTDSFARPIVALLLAASSLGTAAQAASRSASDEISDVDQLGLAQQAVARGDNAEALSRYVRVLATRPRDLNALVGAGNAAVDLGDFSAGLAFFGRAEEVDPHNGRVKAGLASALAQTEQPGAALKLFDEAVSLGVPEAEIAGDRGLAWDLRGNPRRAQRDYALALANKSDHEVSMRLALSQAISGDRETALRTLEPWLRKQDQGAWRTRAFVLAITGDTRGASQAASAVLPQAQADAMTPFFAKLAALNPAQKAMAANFGYLPGDQPKAVQQALTASSAMAAAGARGGASPQGGSVLVSREPPPRSAAPILPDTRAKAAEPKPVVAAVQKPAAPPASLAPTPAVATRPPVRQLPFTSPGPTMIAAAVTPPPATPAKPVAVAAVPPAGPLPVTKPVAASQIERAPAVAAPAVGAAEPVVPRPAVAVASQRQASASPPRPAETVVADARPVRAAEIVTITPAELAELQAQTAADANAEAQADRTIATETTPVASPARAAEAQVEAEAPAKTAESGPAEARAKLPEPPSQPVAIPAPARTTEARAKPVEAPVKIAEAPAKPLGARPNLAETPARLGEGAPKIVEARAKPVELRPDESGRALPLPATSRSAKAPQAAPVSPPRPIRFLPISKDVARAFAALPRGSALSADIAVDKSPAAAKLSPKKAELAANDVDQTPVKSRKPVGDKVKGEAAGEESAKPARKAKADEEAKAVQVAKDAKAAREAKAAPAAQALKDAQAAKAVKEAKAADAARTAKDAQDASAAEAARKAKAAREAKVAQAAQAFKDEQAARAARQARDAQAAQALKDAQAAKAAKLAQDARDARAAREAKAAEAAQALKDAQAAKAAKLAQDARDARAAREAKAAEAARALKDAQAAKAAKLAQDARDARAAREAKAAEAAQAAKEAQAARAAKLAQAASESARDRSDRTAVADSATKARSGGERYWVQVAGGANKADLTKAWARLKAGPAGPVLNGRTASTTPLNATNRLLVGPFADKDEAQSFINKLAAQGTSSFHFVSTAGQKVDKLHGP